jgi:hypothetical protein
MIETLLDTANDNKYRGGVPIARLWILMMYHNTHNKG